MGIVKSTLLISALACAFSASAAKEYTPMDDSVASHLCAAAATMPLASFGQAVSNKYVTTLPSAGFKDLANNLYCNGENVIKFAQRAGNDQIADKLSMFKRGNVSIKEIAYTAHGKVAITSI